MAITSFFNKHWLDSGKTFQGLHLTPYPTLFPMTICLPKFV